MDIYDITASALTAQRLRMDTISGNLANVNSTRNESGELAVYKRKNVVFAPIYENAVKRFSPSGMGGHSGIGGAQSLAMRPAANGISFDASGHATLNLSISNGAPATPGAGVQVMEISDGGGEGDLTIHAPGYAGADANGNITIPKDTRMVFDPDHPDAIKLDPNYPADQQKYVGYVLYPNVNVVTEMVDMISATRAYEANVTALQSAKAMAQSALEI